MFEDLILPKIIAIGVFDADVRYKEMIETKDRNVSFFEIDLVTEDGGQAYVNGKNFTIKENTIICAKPGDIRHTVLPFRCFYIHMAIKKGLIYDVFSRIPSHFVPKNVSEIKEVYLNLIEAYNFPDDKSEYIIAENLFRLCRLINDELGSRTNSENMKKSINRPEIIEDAVEYISQKYSEKLTLEDLSARANLSPTYFQKLFLKAVGRTPCEYIQDIRIRAAKGLLLTTDMPLVDVANECGFPSQSYFNYTFKKAEGCTPKSYRNAKYSEYLLEK